MINKTKKAGNVVLTLFIIAFLIISSSCEIVEGLNTESDGTYTISAGNHYSNERALKSFSGEHLRFRVMFDSSAVYTTTDPRNQADINKLYGFSDCGSIDHHNNSARFGWRWYNDELQILAYVYSDGTRNEAFVKSFELNEEYVLNLEIIDNQYVFTVDGEENVVTMQRGCDSPDNSKNMLYPYFGGDERAPHDITIVLEDLSDDTNQDTDDVTVSQPVHVGVN